MEGIEDCRCTDGDHVGSNGFILPRDMQRHPEPAEKQACGHMETWGLGSSDLFSLLLQRTIVKGVMVTTVAAHSELRAHPVYLV
jgi:hypothetical protein